MGLWLGFAVFASLGVALYGANEYLAMRIGRDNSMWILGVPAFFAIFIVPIVRDIYARFARRRYCAKHGHKLMEFDSKAGRHVVMCERCGSFLEGSRPL